VAPDKFKGTLTAVEAARAIAVGWRRVHPDHELDEMPMADGGEGTLDALLGALGGEFYSAEVSGPLGDPLRAEYGIAPSQEGPVGIVEMARASGLELLAESRRNPRRTTTRGTGELILAALEHDIKTLIVCIGGSATNDGGAGMAQALGARLLDAEGDEMGPGGEQLLSLERVDISALDARLRAVRVRVACDVDNPLCGPTGAAAVYGPQKGASPEDVMLLDHALGHYAAVLHRDLAIDIRDEPGAGAAGGLGAGLVAFLGARLRPGVDIVAEAVHLEDRIAAADLVISGEGRFDEQSLHGKTAHGVMLAALEAKKLGAILCGVAEATDAGVEIRSLADAVGVEQALAEPRRSLENLAQSLGETWPSRA